MLFRNVKIREIILTSLIKTINSGRFKNNPYFSIIDYVLCICFKHKYLDKFLAKKNSECTESTILLGKLTQKSSLEFTLRIFLRKLAQYYSTSTISIIQCIQSEFKIRLTFFVFYLLPE